MLDEDMAGLSPFVRLRPGVHGACSFVLPGLAPGAIRGPRDPDAGDDDEVTRRSHDLPGHRASLLERT